MKKNRSHLAEILIPLACILYTSFFSDSGWIPHDEGVLAQAAERLLHGERPHVDFNETYTGGLNYLHAFAFKLLGTHLLAMRGMLLFFTAIYFFTLYFFLRKKLRTWEATLLLLLAAAWGPPNYFSGLPSWYVFFFSFFSFLFLDRFNRLNQRTALFFAGVFSALSFLMKLPGIYMVGAGYLFLAYIHRRFRPLAVLLATAAPLAVLQIISPKLSIETVFYFLCPALLAAVPLLYRARDIEFEAQPEKKAGLDLIAFTLGVFIPVSLFMIPYLALDGGISSLFNGIFVTPRARYDQAFYPLPPIQTSLAGLPVLLATLLLLFREKKKPISTFEAVVLQLPLLTLILCFLVSHQIYSFTWWTARTLPFLAVFGLVISITRKKEQTVATENEGRSIYLVVCTLALFTLIQFPYSFGIYFIYGFGFLIPALAFLLGSNLREVRIATQLLVMFFIGFGFFFLHPGDIRTKGVAFTSANNQFEIESEKSRLRVNPADAWNYSLLLEFMRENPPNDRIFAGPDSPEVYFLADKKNLTPILYEFFNPKDGSETEIIRRMSGSEIQLAVINLFPEFSRPFSKEFHASLHSLFKEKQRIGKFLIYFNRRQ